MAPKSLHAQETAATSGAARSAVFLITGLSRDGAQVQMTRIIEGLLQRGWTLRVVSMLPLEAMAGDLRGLGLEVRSLNMPRGLPDPTALAVLCRWLRAWQPDVLTGFLYHANVLARLAGRLAGTPSIVSSIRNEHFGGAHRERLLRVTDRLGHVTVVNSELVKRTVVAKSIVPEARVLVIPNGIDPDEFTPCPAARDDLRRMLGMAEEHFLWTAIGRLEPQKDHQNLLRAFRLVADRDERARLLIVGAGRLEHELRRQVSAYGLASRVRLVGPTRNVRAVLSAMDALVLSSAWEGMPNVLMETLAAGKPAVSTQVGGVLELTGEDGGALLVPPRRPDELAAAMDRLMDLPPDARAVLGDRGRSRVRARFGLGTTVDRWDAVLTRLVAPTAARARGASKSPAHVDWPDPAGTRWRP